MLDNPKKIAVFDFDGTLFQGDATKDFCWFYYRKRPLKSYYFLVQVAYWFINHLGLISTTKFKSKFIAFLNNNDAKQIEDLLTLFWEQKRAFVREHLLNEIKELKKNGIHIVVVSASPELFIKDFCLTLGIDVVIGTQLMVKNNKYSLLKNCRGKEKLVRLKQAIPGFEIVSAYSDNEDDTTLLKLAKTGYWVDKKGEISPVNPE
jgi:HAD superfamily hydrolase (TIGR01490 family)